jgi:hypothetical protein
MPRETGHNGLPHACHARLISGGGGSHGAGDDSVLLSQPFAAELRLLRSHGRIREHLAHALLLSLQRAQILLQRWTGVASVIMTTSQHLMQRSCLPSSEVYLRLDDGQPSVYCWANHAYSAGVCCSITDVMDMAHPDDSFCP